MTREQAKSLNVAAAGILQAVDVAGSLGAPGGVLYMGLMSSGYSIAEYQAVVGALEEGGLVLKSGDCYTLTDKGREMNAKVTAAIQAAAERVAA